MPIFIGTAGWSIPNAVADRFPAEGTALQRYAAILQVAEINSSFHRPHRISTWERWRDSVPMHFRFSVKLPKKITHIRKLIDCSVELDVFLQEAQTLGDRLAVLLVQLPPKLAYDPTVARHFFSNLTSRTSVAIACEPRHISWFGQQASDLLQLLGVARVGADPAVCDVAATPGDWGKLSYWRLHGSPAVYRSSYLDRIDVYAVKLGRQVESGSQVWCIFDNTASPAAASDALALKEAVTRYHG